MIEESNSETTAVDVFTHSSTGFPGAWSEDEIFTLLDSWEEVVEEARSPTKKSDAAYKVLIRLRKKGFRKVDKEDVRKQMSTLQTEYRTFLGLQKIGIPTVKAKCINKLQSILGTSTDRSQNGHRVSTSNVDLSEESDSTLVTPGIIEGTDDRDATSLNTTADAPGDEDSNVSVKKRRYRRRLNIGSLIQQQQTALLDIQKIGESNEEANRNIVNLLTELVSLHKSFVEKQDKIIEGMKL